MRLRTRHLTGIRINHGIGSGCLILLQLLMTLYSYRIFIPVKQQKHFLSWSAPLQVMNISSDLLFNGANVFTLHDYYNGTDPNYLAKDWFEIEYPKYLNLSGDSLYFEFRDNFSNKIAMIKVGNALSSLNDYEIFKVKPFLKKIENAQIIAGNIFFSDTVNTNDVYVILNSANIAKPKFYYKKNFVNLRKSRQTDYIAITHPLFLNSAQAYVNSIAQLYSVNNPFLVNVNDIF